MSEKKGRRLQNGEERSEYCSDLALNGPWDFKKRLKKGGNEGSQGVEIVRCSRRRIDQPFSLHSHIE